MTIIINFSLCTHVSTYAMDKLQYNVHRVVHNNNHDDIYDVHGKRMGTRPQPHTYAHQRCLRWGHMKATIMRVMHPNIVCLDMSNMCWRKANG